MKEKLKYHLLMLLCLIIGIGLILILNKLFEKPTVLLYVLIGAIIFALVGTTKVLGNKIKKIDRIKFEEEDQKYKESWIVYMAGGYRWILDVAQSGFCLEGF